MAGKKISRANMAHIHAAADHLHQIGANYPGKGGPDRTPIGKADLSLNDQMQAVAMAVYQSGGDMSAGCCVEEVYDTFVIIDAGGDTYYQADYTTDADGNVTLAARESWVQVEEIWQPVSASMKAGSLYTPMADTDPYTVIASVKALSDRTLELRVAWGWDNHQEQFHPSLTDFDLDNYPTPPVAYYHGFDQKGKKAPKPVYIGKTISRENRADGHYLTAKLNTKPEADRVWTAALKGDAVVSPGTAGHLIRKEADGTLTYWPIVEISAWEYAPSRKQAHPRSRAFPVLKALYQEAGIALPPSFDTQTDPPPEAPGDGAASADPVVAESIIAGIVTENLLALRKG